MCDEHCVDLSTYLFLTSIACLREQVWSCSRPAEAISILYMGTVCPQHLPSKPEETEENDLKNSTLLLFPCPHAPLTLQAGQHLCVSDGLVLDKGTYHQVIYLFSDGEEQTVTQFPKLYSKT